MRVSATTLELFRKVRDVEFVPAKDLEESIKDVFVWRDEMKWGAAFHDILRFPDKYRNVEGTAYTCDGICFPADVVAPCLDVFDRSGLWEVKATKDYDVDGRTVRVVCKADQIVGAKGIENKTKWGTYEPDGYIDSYQWRFMVDILRFVSLTYNVFCLSRYADGSFGLRSIQSMDLYPYPDLGADCEALLREFVAYVERQGLASYLERPEAVGVLG